MDGGSRVNVKAEKVYVTTFRTLPLYCFRAILKKIAHMSRTERMYLCGFVALCVRMSVAGANKGEGRHIKLCKQNTAMLIVLREN